MEEQRKKEWLAQVGERVWKCRTGLGLSREKLAERLDISPQYVSDIEQGKKCMSMAIFVELSQVLEVSLEYLAHGALPKDPAGRAAGTPPEPGYALGQGALAARMLLLALKAAEALGPEE